MSHGLSIAKGKAGRLIGLWAGGGLKHENAVCISNIARWYTTDMNKIAVITGASYGLGSSISSKLIELDYKVYGISRTKPSISGPNFIWIKADLLNSEELHLIRDQVSEKHIDVLINNAGICFFKKTLDYTDDDFNKIFNLNFKVPIKIAQLFFDELAGGLLLNISSLSDRYPDPDFGLYSSSKTALNLFFETMAAENDQVKIINILPSYVDTPMQHGMRKGKEFDWNICMMPEDISEAVNAILSNIGDIASGSRVIVEKSIEADELYTPEMLWTYSVAEKDLKKLR